jgi:hypothetical protein
MKRLDIVRQFPKKRDYVAELDIKYVETRTTYVLREKGFVKRQMAHTLMNKMAHPNVSAGACWIPSNAF